MDREFVVTLSVQLVVREANAADARAAAVSSVVDMINQSDYRADPMNCYLVEDIEDISIPNDDIDTVLTRAITRVD